MVMWELVAVVVAIFNGTIVLPHSTEQYCAMLVSQHSTPMSLTMDPFTIVHAAIGKATHAVSMILAIDKFTLVPHTGWKSLNAIAGTLSLNERSHVEGSVLPGHAPVGIVGKVGHEAAFVLSSVGIRLTTLPMALSMFESPRVGIAVFPYHTALAGRPSVEDVSAVHDIHAIAIDDLNVVDRLTFRLGCVNVWGRS